VEPVIKERYQLYHGDCLERMKSIPDESIDMVLCDLPYGTTKAKWDSVIDLESLWKEYNRIAKDKTPIVLFGSQPFTTLLISSNTRWFRHELIWNKRVASCSFNVKVSPLKTHENILVFARKSANYYPVMKVGKRHRRSRGGNNCELFGEMKPRGKETWSDEWFPTTVLNYDKKKHQLHPTAKPVPLLEYLIKTYSKEGETILDNCMGSASTAIACLNMNRKFIGIEKDDKYFSIGVKRMRRESAVVKSSEN
jgi:site-specific DNA-methyltransferase (adenine-specific)